MEKIFYAEKTLMAISAIGLLGMALGIIAVWTWVLIVSWIVCTVANVLLSLSYLISLLRKYNDKPEVKKAMPTSKELLEKLG